MAKNDRILLDRVLSDAAKTRGVSDEISLFQGFALEQLLKDRDFSTDEIQVGIVDGRADGGIDAWYTIIDGELIADPADIPNKCSVSTVELRIYTCKHHDTFRLEPVVNLFTAASELFDLSKDEESLSDRYNEAVLTCRNLFREALIGTARSNARLQIRFAYVSRGDASSVAENIR